MEISVQPPELIEALAERVAALVVDLEKTRLALRKAQAGIIDLEIRLAEAER